MPLGLPWARVDGDIQIWALSWDQWTAHAVSTTSVSTPCSTSHRSAGPPPPADDPTVSHDTRRRDVESRWILLIPGISDDAAVPALTESAHRTFEQLHVWLGTILGETVGYALTATFTVLVVTAFTAMPRSPAQSPPAGPATSGMSQQL